MYGSRQTREMIASKLLSAKVNRHRIMSIKADVVFLLDVDNTLLDTDSFLLDMRNHFAHELEPDVVDRFWAISGALRNQRGYVDYLGALQRLRVDNLNVSKLLQIASFLIDYPYADRLFPEALAAVNHLHTLGSVVILSDGDAVFQPRKIQRSGLWDAVDGRVLIYIHKEQMLADIVQQYPAKHYVMVDDKLRILAAMKASWLSRITTVFPRQGHYANDPKEIAAYPPADLTIADIGELTRLKRSVGL